MVKPEWGTKRTCPKCATRFYDLGKDEPVTCIECGTTFAPEPVLKSKQPIPYEEEAKKEEPEVEDTDLADEELSDIDEGVRLQALKTLTTLQNLEKEQILEEQEAAKRKAEEAAQKKQELGAGLW